MMKEHPLNKSRMCVCIKIMLSVFKDDFIFLLYFSSPDPRFLSVCSCDLYHPHGHNLNLTLNEHMTKCQLNTWKNIKFHSPVLYRVKLFLVFFSLFVCVNFYTSYFFTLTLIPLNVFRMFQVTKGKCIFSLRWRRMRIDQAERGDFRWRKTNHFNANNLTKWH